MKSVNNFYYECEKGHLTVGETDRKKKCPMIIREVKLTKKDKEVIREHACGENIIKVIQIPEELDYFNEWDFRLTNAFMDSQTSEHLKVEFINDLQRIFAGLQTKITDLEKQIEEIETPDKEEVHHGNKLQLE